MRVLLLAMAGHPWSGEDDCAMSLYHKLLLVTSVWRPYAIPSPHRTLDATYICIVRVCMVQWRQTAV